MPPHTGSTGSIVVVISPLTSLMNDQAAKFSPPGLVTDFIFESLVDKEKTRRVLHGRAQLVFFSPENFINNQRYHRMLRSATYKEKLVALVIHEAHCVQDWIEEFRVPFAVIGDFRRLLPSHVKVLALTAAATQETLRVVTLHLSMRDVAVVGLPPSRANTMFKMQPFQKLDKFTTSLCTDLMRLRLDYPKTVVFCRTYDDAADLYITMRSKLGGAFTHPPNVPVCLQQFRLVDMYHRLSTVDMREKVLASIAQPGSTLRLLFVKTDFGTGVDCRDVQNIIHWGAPDSIEQYVLETETAGQDVVAVLQKGKIGRHVGEPMKNYIENSSSCRRKLLLKDFLLYGDECVDGCKCCDVCAESCTCSTCS